MQAYPKYKESGIPWLGQIPEHWETDKVSQLFVERRAMNTMPGGARFERNRTRPERAIIT